MLKDNQILKIRKIDKGLQIELETKHNHATYTAAALICNIDLQCVKNNLVMRIEAVIIFLQKKTENIEL